MPFRTRSPRRDAENDRRRFDRVHGVVVDVVGEIERERTGLNRRLQTALDLAGASVGNDDDFSRDPIAERMLSDAERTIRSCRDRLAALDGMLDQYGELLSAMTSSSRNSVRTERTTR